MSHPLQLKSNDWAFRPRRWLRLSLCTFGGIIAVCLGVTAVYVWRSYPTLDGELQVRGLQAPVQVTRDTADVTHIVARTQADAFFALGYVHAQERSWQLEVTRRLVNGSMSEVFGRSTLDTDKLVRTLGIPHAAQAQWMRLSPRTKTSIEAYSRGINAFHATSAQALPPEFHFAGVAPGLWKPEDSIAVFLMIALELGGNWGSEMARLWALQRLSTAQLWQLMPPSDGGPPPVDTDLAGLYARLGIYRAEGPLGKSLAQSDAVDRRFAALGHVQSIGSNAWVVAGAHARSGKPLLAGDPHLALSAPSAWYMAGLNAPAAPDGAALDVVGATMPGLPWVVLGRTAGVAWSLTNTGADVQDLYLEELNPLDARQYRTPSGWAHFEERDEVIHVKGSADHHLRVLATRHGPVVSHDNPVFASVVDSKRFVLALRWAALDRENRSPEAALRANYAQSVDALIAAFTDYHSPMQNLLAADTQGRTAFRAIGRVPVRSKANDIQGLAPAPGWDAKYDWTGWLPAGENPHVDHGAIVARGWHASANQRNHDPGYPHFISADWASPERFERIEALLSATEIHDGSTMRAMQMDVVSLATKKLLPILQATQGTHPLAAAASARLQAFDGAMESRDAAPLIFAEWANELTRILIAPRIGTGAFHALANVRTFRPGLEAMLLQPSAAAFWCGREGCGAASARALDLALARIAEQQGPDISAWRWGVAHSAVSSHFSAGAPRLLRKLFDVEAAVGGDPWSVNLTHYPVGNAASNFASEVGVSLRMVHDLSDPDASEFILPTGQSGLVFSPRYRDMRDAWTQGHYRPLRRTVDQWAHRLTLVP